MRVMKYKWYHHVFTWSSADGINVYVDGIKTNKPTTKASFAMLDQGAKKNGRSSLGKPIVVGPTQVVDRPTISMRNFALWNKQLSAAEASLLYKLEGEGHCHNFITYPLTMPLFHWSKIQSATLCNGQRVPFMKNSTSFPFSFHLRF